MMDQRVEILKRDLPSASSTRADLAHRSFLNKLCPNLREETRPISPVQFKFTAAAYLSSMQRCVHGPRAAFQGCASLASFLLLVRGMHLRLRLAPRFSTSRFLVVSRLVALCVATFRFCRSRFRSSGNQLQSRPALTWSDWLRNFQSVLEESIFLFSLEGISASVCAYLLVTVVTLPRVVPLHAFDTLRKCLGPTIGFVLAFLHTSHTSVFQRCAPAAYICALVAATTSALWCKSHPRVTSSAQQAPVSLLLDTYASLICTLVVNHLYGFADIQAVGLFHAFDLQVWAMLFLRVMLSCSTQSILEHIFNVPGSLDTLALCAIISVVLEYESLKHSLCLLGLAAVVSLTRMWGNDTKNDVIHAHKHRWLYLLLLTGAHFGVSPMRSRESFAANVSVCIPVIPKDLEGRNTANFMRTLTSIRDQTRQPREVILGLSESNEVDAERVRRIYQRVIAPVKFKVKAIPTVGSVGTNRNSAASIAVGDILSFFDADGDIMHPQRIAIIDDIFQLHPQAKVVLHGFSRDTVARAIHTNHSIIVPNYILCHHNAIRKWHAQHEWILPTIHHGHLSIRKQLFTEHKFATDFGGEEDSKYVNSVVGTTHCDERENPVVYIKEDLTLGYYARSEKRSKGSNFEMG